MNENYKKTTPMELKVMFGLSILIFAAILFFSFSVRVNPGEIGIKIDMYGDDKGVEVEVLTTGRNFFNAITHDVVTYPSYIQQENYESLQFQDQDGLMMGADVAISYKFTPENIPSLYQEYRREADHITEVYFPTWIKNAMVKESATMKVDKIYGEQKEDFRSNVLASLRKDFDSKGIYVEDIYFTNGITIPKAVSNRISEKIKATQIAQQKENELQAVTAEAAKRVAEEEGKAKSRIIEAESRANANKILNSSLTSNVIRFKELELQKDAITKWNGAQPTVVGGSEGLILDLGTLK